MKIEKSHVQKNLRINKNFINVDDINDLLQQKKVFYFINYFDVCYDRIDSLDFENYDFYIPTAILDSIDVGIDFRYGYYCVWATYKDGYSHIVSLL